ncbi:MAG: phosphoribosylanthranilate isomerase, partial [Bacteroidetes bacterium]
MKFKQKKTPNMSDFGPDENRFIIKVCGMREPENIRAVAALPVDWMGFIFYEKSPRFVRRKPDVDFGTARPKRVGVFVNEKIPTVLARVSEYDLDAVQLHGDESPEYCASLRKVWPQIQIVKVFSVGPGFDFAQTALFEGVCDWFLFDTKGENRGGNGRT